ncbi:helix-turn-helix domain-containing protein [Labrenzia suaedae]|uniref:Helix-turn-helix domain-containing protein n=1 Tax=Roseibium litorale TaxID=2803841 RepID=A0ABR9CQU9_9HYPH|nr:helix-turn-helix domain-containing protein [Roseibium litorale]MBD8892662.1 helix-turn-helix domain-containing protein [Roseibium litorale]
MGLSYSHFSREERRKIERWRQAKVSPATMAKIFGRRRSETFRELKRNHFQDDQLPGPWLFCCGGISRPIESLASPDGRESACPPNSIVTSACLDQRQGDLMLFKQHFSAGNVTSQVEPVTRFTVLLKNGNRKTHLVPGRVIEAMRHRAIRPRKSIPFDRGAEFTAWPHPQAEIGTRPGSVIPLRTGQKGTVENTSRRARR